MPEFLKSAFADVPAVSPLFVLARLLLALVFGGVIAWVHRWTRRGTEPNPSFFATLVLLCVLIAMVTQVIGDNVARAFSLVGALSIVRFRTVLRDTQDTAYVIFAVVVGMAVGARNPWAATVGTGVVSLAAFLLMPRAGVPIAPPEAYLLTLRIGLGHDLNEILGEPVKAFLQTQELISIGTARQGTSLEAVYRARLCSGTSAADFVRILNRTEGVQDIQLQLRNFQDT